MTGTRQDLVRRGDPLLPSHQHGLLDGEALLQRLEGLVGSGAGRAWLEQIDGLPEGIGRLGRADMAQQPGLIAERRGEAGAADGIVNAQLLRQFGYD